jgi:hypothetical protein
MLFAIAGKIVAPYSDGSKSLKSQPGQLQPTTIPKWIPTFALLVKQV